MTRSRVLLPAPLAPVTASMPIFNAHVHVAEDGPLIERFADATQLNCNHRGWHYSTGQRPLSTKRSCTVSRCAPAPARCRLTSGPLLCLLAPYPAPDGPDDQQRNDDQDDDQAAMTTSSVDGQGDESLQGRHKGAQSAADDTEWLPSLLRHDGLGASSGRRLTEMVDMAALFCR